MGRRLVGLVGSLLLGVMGCAPEAGRSEERPVAASAEKSEALIVEAGRRALAYDFYPSLHVPHGVAGDEHFVFVTQPLSGRVAVVDRFSGAELATLPTPPSGWLLPFALRVPQTGRLVVLDAGGFPNPFIPSVARLYEYDYQRTPAGFTATLARTISFEGLPLVFAEEFEVVPGGGYVVSESVLGAIWYVGADGAISPGLFPDLATGTFIPQLSPCGFPQVSIGEIPFVPMGGVAPGVGAMAIRDGQLYFGSSCRGGVARVPLASLLDPTRAPWQRAADIVDVSPRPAGVVAESLKGFSFNRWNPGDAHLYVTDALGRRVLRVDLTSGAREVVADDPELFDFPVSAQFLPPVAGFSPLVVASDQEYRLSALNQAIESDLLHPPFIVAKVLVNPH